MCVFLYLHIYICVYMYIYVCMYSGASVSALATIARSSQGQLSRNEVALLRGGRLCPFFFTNFSLCICKCIFQI